MKLLLDENLPKRLKQDFQEFEIYTVRDQGWNGVRNGDLLKRLLDTGFKTLITFDKNLRHQQNFDKYPIAVFVLVAENNTYSILSELVENVRLELNQSLKTGATTIQK